eukprot:3131679-Prorocentrum_lima.AAC.1
MQRTEPTSRYTTQVGGHCCCFPPKPLLLAWERTRRRWQSGVGPPQKEKCKEQNPPSLHYT